MHTLTSCVCSVVDSIEVSRHLVNGVGSAGIISLNWLLVWWLASLLYFACNWTEHQESSEPLYANTKLPISLCRLKEPRTIGWSVKLFKPFQRLWCSLVFEHAKAAQCTEINRPANGEHRWLISRKSEESSSPLPLSISVPLVTFPGSMWKPGMKRQLSLLR